MNCCPTSDTPHPPRRSHLLRAAAVLALVLASSMAQAQVNLRKFPPQALRGAFTVVQSHAVVLDGQPDRLSPGAKIYDERNMLTLSGNLTGNTYLVNYTREISGHIHQVWILTPEEAAEKRPGAQPATNFIFSSDADKPPADDGKTPYNQLPKYGK